jgi:hypothetical protein
MVIFLGGFREGHKFGAEVHTGEMPEPSVFQLKHARITVAASGVQHALSALQVPTDRFNLKRDHVLVTPGGVWRSSKFFGLRAPVASVRFKKGNAQKPILDSIT